MANYNNLLSTINGAISTNGTGAITGQLLQTVLDGMVASLGAKYQYAGVATPATNPGTPDENVFYFAAQAGTYTNFGGLVVNDGEVCALKWDGTWVKDVTGAATVEQVSQLGQEVKDTYGDYIENPEWVKVVTDNDGKILYGVKTDGKFYFGGGCPPQVKEYIEDKIASLSLDEYEDIVAFLYDYLGSDTTLKVMIDGLNAQIATKLDAEGLDPDALATIQATDNPEFIEAKTDSEGKLLAGRTPDGAAFEKVGFSTPEMSIGDSTIQNLDNPEYIDVKIDNEGKIIEGTKRDGSKYFGGRIDWKEFSELKSEFITSNKDLNNSAPHFKRILIEDGNKVHSTGYTYTAFGDGCTFRGQEVYVQRCGHSHLYSAEDRGKIVFYVRQDDGSFTHTFAPLDYNSVNYEYRDPHINLARGGDYLLLSCFSDNGNIEPSYLWVLDRQFNVAYPKTMICPSTHIAWGKVLQTPSGHFICACYKYPQNGVDLFRTSGTDIDAPGTFENVAEIIPSLNEEANEPSLAYWGNKLICVARRKVGENMVYAETSDLEGLTGWQYSHLPMQGHCPCLQPYIDEKEPLIVVYGGWEYSGLYGYPIHGRSPYIRATFDRNSLLSGNANWTEIGVIDTINYGGYPSFVKNRFGYGCMFYEDVGSGLEHTNLWFKDVDIERYLSDLSELKWRHNNINF